MTSHAVIQSLFGSLFGVLILRLLYLGYQGTIPRLRALFWVALWGSGLALVLNPEWTNEIARFLGVARGADAVNYVAIAFLSVLVFRLFQLIDAQDRELSKLTTRIALYEWEKGREIGRGEGEGDGDGEGEIYTETQRQ